MNRMSRLAVRGFNHEALIELRRRAEMTQEDLAILLGVSSTSISSWELGKSAPDPANFARLSEVLGGVQDKLLRQVDELRGLAEHRVRAGLSQIKAAEAAGMPGNALRLIERGVRLPTPDERAALAAAYGIPQAEVERLAENLHRHRKDRKGRSS